MRRPLVLAALALLGAAAAPAGAAAALRSTDCHGFRCATLSVPLDRTGAVPGQVGLKVAFQSGDKPVLVALSGGPGQPSVAYASSFASSLKPALDRYRLAVVDQRGTGGSGVLRCPGVQSLTTLEAYTPATVAGCGASIGARRAFYGTVDTVDDLEALRVALGVPKLALMGVSYGTFVAVQYARIHPDRVDRLILDSTIGPDGVDSFSLDSLSRLPRVLRSLCADRGCPGAPDPLADLGVLVRRVSHGGTIAAPVYDRSGRARRTRLATAGALQALMLSGDLNPGLLTLLPGALRAAVAGDDAPLVRLRRAVDGVPLSAKELSFGLFTATTCADLRLPYALSDPPAARDAKLAAAAGALDPAVYAPFAMEDVRAGSYGADCSRWPGEPLPRPVSTAPLPDVPALILGGGLDTRTPIENAHQLAALLPRATVVEVPGNGHDELDTDVTGCATLALKRFVRDQAVGTPCAGQSDRPVIAAQPPLRLRDVPRAQRIAGDRGRVVSAALATYRDAIDMVLTSAAAQLPHPGRGGGLRGGSFAFDELGAMRLARAAYVPGVRVSGTVRVVDQATFTGTLRVDAPGRRLDGTVTASRGGRVTARLGGRRAVGSARRTATRTAPAVRPAPVERVLAARASRAPR